jgi:hypothetical protein
LNCQFSMRENMLRVSWIHTIDPSTVTTPRSRPTVAVVSGSIVFFRRHTPRTTPFNGGITGSPSRYRSSKFGFAAAVFSTLSCFFSKSFAK